MTFSLQSFSLKSALIAGTCIILLGAHTPAHAAELSEPRLLKEDRKAVNSVLLSAVSRPAKTWNWRSPTGTSGTLETQKSNRSSNCRSYTISWKNPIGTSKINGIACLDPKTYRWSIKREALVGVVPSPSSQHYPTLISTAQKGFMLLDMYNGEIDGARNPAFDKAVNIFAAKMNLDPNIIGFKFLQTLNTVIASQKKEHLESAACKIPPNAQSNLAFTPLCGIVADATPEQQPVVQ
jgi:hypothetical protein